MSLCQDEPGLHQNLQETEIVLESIQNDKEAIEFSKWTKDKAVMKYHGNMPSFPIYNNFVYWCNLRD